LPVENALDYCQWDTFNASCPQGYVVVIDSARYGRMQDGRCVKRSYGAMGCMTDVLSLADHRCSGRVSCKISVTEIPLIGIRPCPDDLTSYLEIGYHCVPGKYISSYAHFNSINLVKL